jgi:dTDP-4-amino-4,6-dideoxygalactose transaminase
MIQWQVPLFDPDLDESEAKAVADVIRSKWLTMGDRTTEFERSFAEFCGTRHAIAVNSCTAALHLSLLASGVGPGDDVVLPALTFVATANAVRYCGARPVFADVASMDDWNVSRESLQRALTPKTRAIVVVHYAGYPCRMDDICALARERGVIVIEDVAHAPGASLAGRCTGAWGDAGCFSFFSNKNMTTGEGGMVTTDSDDLAARIKLLRSHGMTTQTLDRHKGHAFAYDVTALGYNFRMSEFNAALGLCQLARLSGLNERRREVSSWYRRRLADIGGLQVPFSTYVGEPCHHIFPVLLPHGVDRARVMQGMKAAGIQTSIHYRPVDTFTAYVEAGLGPCSHLSLTHDIGSRALTLPLFPGMSQEQVELVATALTNSIGA